MKITNEQYEMLLNIDNANFTGGSVRYTDYDEEILKSLHGLNLITFNGEYLEVTKLGGDVVSGDAVYEITKPVESDEQVELTKPIEPVESDEQVELTKPIEPVESDEQVEENVYVLELGIEPSKIERKKRKERFPLSKMKEGESFVLIPAGETNDKLRVSAINSVNYFNKNTTSDLKFKVGYGPSGETRVFCLKK